jgi:hypothetical protein
MWLEPHLRAKAFLLQQAFYSIDEYLSYMQAPWKGIV